MVGKVIDIHRLNLEELMGVVSIYPWYAGARMELCSRMAGAGSLSSSQLSQAALYVSSRRLLSELARRGGNYADADVANLLKGAAAEPAAPAEQPREETPQEFARRIFVVGGDYFSSSQYRAVKQEDDNIFSSFANSGREVVPESQAAAESFDFCTETLAQIYAEQGYNEEAKQIYSKLSLLYPEKSVYFAALIEKLDKN
ncbi:MAG: hypothetical protein J5695_00920 [Bacteroidales bacterium]|nr:hypothetical protein [Bacteroidales bacterium]MBO4565766.1 hypothetical protein [Bacteroidales bacterium]